MFILLKLWRPLRRGRCEYKPFRENARLPVKVGGFLGSLGIVSLQGVKATVSEISGLMLHPAD